MPASNEPCSPAAVEPEAGETSQAAVIETTGSAVEPIMLPPPEVPHRAGLPLGASAAFLVLILAFLLAFMPVRNSDFWLHLAAGRNLLEQQEASFSYLEATPWLNHSWLYEILLYEAYSWLGGTSLIVLKACLAVAMGLLLLLTGRIGRSFWIPAGATMLTLIAMGPWLSFRPIFVSYLCFAVTLYLLRRWEEGASNFRTLLALGFLFALWANLDGWFILGCLLVGCWCVGQFLRPDTSPKPRPRRVPALLLLCCMAACLVNPNHVLVFLPQADWMFSEVAHNLRTDSLLRVEIVAPWQGTYLSGRFYHSGPGLAFWLLVLFGLLSFCMARKTMASRGVVWGVFLVLSFFQTPVIPFFAMVAGTTLALNAGAWLAESQLAASGWASLTKAGLILTSLALAAGAWIGLFQSSILEPRSGTVEVDPGLVRLAGRLREWRQQGLLGNGNGFHLAPETANQLAWLCPKEKGFLNSHLRVSPVAASEYVAVRQGLLAQPGSESTNWRLILRAHGINHVVIYSNNAAQVEQAVGNLARSSQEWPLLYFGEGAAVFGWRDPALAQQKKKLEPVPVPADLFKGIEKSLDTLAFSPKEATSVPATATEEQPQRFQWWHAFWKRRPVRAPDLREALLALTLYDALSPMHHARNVTVWNACASAGLVAEVSSSAGFSLLPGMGGIRHELFFSVQDGGPPAALYLALRAARRAINNNPDEPSAYFALGEAYYRLHTTTRERFWSTGFPELGRLRTVQAITAYHNALRLDRNLAAAHDRLAHLFISMEYKDLALKHLREYLRGARRQGPFPGETREGMEQRLARPAQILHNLTKEVEHLTDRFDINSSNLKVFDRASLAGRLGLAGKALDILLDSDVSAFGTSGMDMELKLLLVTGNAEYVRLWMNKEHESILQAYRWNKIQLHASLGNYAMADEGLQPTERIRVLNRDLTLHSAAALIYANGILAANRGGLLQKLPLRILVATGKLPVETYRLLPDEDDVVVGLWGVAQNFTRHARLDVVRGLLALESGRIANAEDRFDRALAILKNMPASPFASDPDSSFARAIAEHFLKIIRAERGSQSK